MVRRCPPGVFCIESYTFVMIMIAIIACGFYLFGRITRDTTRNAYMASSRSIDMVSAPSRPPPPSVGIYPRASYSFSNLPGDVLMNPYVAPLRNDSIIPSLDVRGGVAINVPTQGYDTSYRQVGILTRSDGREQILPLMGRPLITNRDKWQFYALSDQNNQIKLPVSKGGKSCTAEYGCDNVYNGDTVYVEGYNDAFKATIYDNQVMRYIPVV